MKNQELVIKNLSRIWFIVPFLIFLLLTISLVLLPFLPQDIFYIIGGIIFVYWIIKGCIFSLFSLIGFFYHTKNGNKEWLINLEKDFGIDEIPFHLIVIPHSDEDYLIIKRCINSIIKQNFPIDKIYVTISIEERSIKKSTKISKHIYKLENDFRAIFKEKLLIFVHPDSKEEVRGAAANRTWGTRKAIKFLEKNKMFLNNFLTTSPDADTVFHPNYLAECSYKWLEDKKSNYNFYQTAFYRVDNNFWNVPIVIRTLSHIITLSILSTSIFIGKGRLTFSCFTVSLRLLKQVNYWDISYPVDDTMLYFKFYNQLNGKFKCKSISSSISVDAVYDKSYLVNIRKQYFQYFRWGYGSLAFSLFLKICLRNKNISKMNKIKKLLSLFEIFFLNRFISIFIFIIFYNLDKLHLNLYARNLLTILLGTNLLLIFFTKILITSKKNRKIKFIYSLILDIPINLLNLFLFYLLPFIHAALRLVGYSGQKSELQWVEKLYKIEE